MFFDVIFGLTYLSSGAFRLKVANENTCKRREITISKRSWLCLIRAVQKILGNTVHEETSEHEKRLFPVFPMTTKYECMMTVHNFLFVYITPGAGEDLFICIRYSISELLYKNTYFTASGYIIVIIPIVFQYKEIKDVQFRNPRFCNCHRSIHRGVLPDQVCVFPMIVWEYIFENQEWQSDWR